MRQVFHVLVCRWADIKGRQALADRDRNHIFFLGDNALFSTGTEASVINLDSKCFHLRDGPNGLAFTMWAD